MIAALQWLKLTLLNNIGLKLISLGLAALLQIVVQHDSVRDSEVDIRLQLANLPKGLLFVGPAPLALKVRVRARWGTIRELLVDHTTTFTADLGQYRDGERYIFDLAAIRQQMLPLRVDVLAVEPASLDVRLDKRASKLVQVEATLTGEVAAGFHLKAQGVVIEPAQVELSGPAHVLANVKSVRTDALALRNSDQDLHATLKLVPPADRRLQLAVDEVQVTVKLDEQRLTKTLPHLAVVLRGCPQQLRCSLEPSEVSATIEGPAHFVSAFLAQPPDNLVFADVAPVLARGETQVGLTMPTLANLTLTPLPAVAKVSAIEQSPRPTADVKP